MGMRDSSPALIPPRNHSPRHLRNPKLNSEKNSSGGSATSSRPPIPNHHSRPPSPPAHGLPTWWPSTAANSQTVSSPSRQSKRRSEEHTSELQSRGQLVCRLLLEKKKREN